MTCKLGAALVLGAGLVGSLATAGADTAGWQDQAAIRAAAEEAVRTRLQDVPGTAGVAADPLDPRLLVAACDGPLAAEVPPMSQDSARVTVEVRCDGQRTWRVFVPVRISLERAVVVAAVPLERGKVLTAGDVILADRDVGGIVGAYLTDVNAAVGQVVRRAIAAGATVAPSQLQAPVLVRRGQTVTLQARSGAITVQMVGEARADGALGQNIEVRNTSSGKILQAIVKNEKTVEVMLP